MAKVHRAYQHSWWRPSKEITTRDCQEMVNFDEEGISYESIARHFGCSVEEVSYQVNHRPWVWGDSHSKDRTYKYSLDEIRDTLDYIDHLKDTGEIDSAIYVEWDDLLRKDKHGNWYFASVEQHMAEKELKEISSFDSKGNLVVQKGL